MIDQQEIDRWFRDHRPKSDDSDTYRRSYTAAEYAIRVLLRPTLHLPEVIKVMPEIVIIDGEHHVALSIDLSCAPKGMAPGVVKLALTDVDFKVHH